MFDELSKEDGFVEMFDPLFKISEGIRALERNEIPESYKGHIRALRKRLDNLLWKHKD